MMIKLATYVLGACAVAGTVTYLVVVVREPEVKKTPVNNYFNYIEQNTKGLKKW